MPEKRYLILHNHPEKLEIGRRSRELLFSTGTVWDIRECAIHSLQLEFFNDISRRPLTLILWGMADRYGVARDKGVEVVEVNGWNEAFALCDAVNRAEASPTR